VFELIFKGENKGVALARGKTQQLDSLFLSQHTRILAEIGSDRVCFFTVVRS